MNKFTTFANDDLLTFDELKKLKSAGTKDRSLIIVRI